MGDAGQQPQQVVLGQAGKAAGLQKALFRGGNHVGLVEPLVRHPSGGPAAIGGLRQRRGRQRLHVRHEKGPHGRMVDVLVREHDMLHDGHKMQIPGEAFREMIDGVDAGQRVHRAAMMAGRQVRRPRDGQRRSGQKVATGHARLQLRDRSRQHVRRIRLFHKVHERFNRRRHSHQLGHHSFSLVPTRRQSRPGGSAPTGASVTVSTAHHGACCAARPRPRRRPSLP